MFKMLKKIVKYRRLTLKYPLKPLDTTFVNGKPVISATACTFCGKCIKHCPTQALVRDDETNSVGINLDECIFCYYCAEVCPVSAVMISRDFELAAKNRNDLRCSPLHAGNQPRIARAVPQESAELSPTEFPKESPEESLAELAQKIQVKASKLFGHSLQIREVDAGSCNGCDYEVNALNNPFNDLERLGIHFVASPRHADMLLVTGPVTRNMEVGLIRTYQAVPDPKLVVAVGACACSGGIFRDSYAVNNGVDSIVPVDVYVPGCPPRPHAILYGILKALDRV